MNARRPTNGRHRSSPPGRQALNNLAMATHFEVENALLRDRIAELEARVAALTNARDELYHQHAELQVSTAAELERLRQENVRAKLLWNHWHDQHQRLVAEAEASLQARVRQIEAAERPAKVDGAEAFSWTPPAATKAP